MTTPTEVVTEYLDSLALGPKGFGRARELLADDLEYHDILMSVDSADGLIAALEQLGTEDAPIELLEMAEGGNTVAVLTTFSLPTGPVHFTQWFWVVDGRISRSRVIYDPRPFLEMNTDSDA